MIGSFIAFSLIVYFCGIIPSKGEHDADCAFCWIMKLSRSGDQLPINTVALWTDFIYISVAPT